MSTKIPLHYQFVRNGEQVCLKFGKAPNNYFCVACINVHRRNSQIKYSKQDLFKKALCGIKLDTEALRQFVKNIFPVYNWAKAPAGIQTGQLALSIDDKELLIDFFNFPDIAKNKPREKIKAFTH